MTGSRSDIGVGESSSEDQTDPDGDAGSLDGVFFGGVLPDGVVSGEASWGRLLAVLQDVDEFIDNWWELNLRGRPPLDRMFYAVSEAANHSIIWHGAGVATALIRRNPRAALELSIALGIESALVNGAVKSLFGRNRPEHDAPRPHSLRSPLTSSFPSGHASAAMVAAALLSRKTRLATVWYVLAGIVASSRIHVRIHHASDVVGGVAVGAILGLIARRILR